MTETVEVGATVVAADGEVGTVEQIIADPTTGELDRLVVRTPDARRVDIPAGLIAASSTAREVRLTGAAALLDEPGGHDAQNRVLEAVGDRLVVPVREEVLAPTTRPVEVGTVRIHKRVETVPVEMAVDVMRDDVTVERVAVDQPVDAVPPPRHEGDTLIIPIVEEVLVTEKRLVLREEVRVTRRQVTEAVSVRDTVRREVVEIEERTDQALAGDATTDQSSAATDAVAGDLPLT